MRYALSFPPFSGGTGVEEPGSVEFSEQEVAQRIRIEKNQVFARICLVTIMILYS